MSGGFNCTEYAVSRIKVVKTHDELKELLENFQNGEYLSSVEAILRAVFTHEKFAMTKNSDRDEVLGEYLSFLSKNPCFKVIQKSILIARYITPISVLLEYGAEPQARQLLKCWISNLNQGDLDQHLLEAIKDDILYFYKRESDFESRQSMVAELTGSGGANLSAYVYQVILHGAYLKLKAYDASPNDPDIFTLRLIAKDHYKDDQVSVTPLSFLRNSYNTYLDLILNVMYYCPSTSNYYHILNTLPSRYFEDSRFAKRLIETISTHYRRITVSGCYGSPRKLANCYLFAMATATRVLSLNSVVKVLMFAARQYLDISAFAAKANFIDRIKREEDTSVLFKPECRSRPLWKLIFSDPAAVKTIGLIKIADHLKDSEIRDLMSDFLDEMSLEDVKAYLDPSQNLDFFSMLVTYKKFELLDQLISASNAHLCQCVHQADNEALVTKLIANGCLAPATVILLSETYHFDSATLTGFLGLSGNLLRDDAERQAYANFVQALIFRGASFDPMPSLDPTKQMLVAFLRGDKGVKNRVLATLFSIQKKGGVPAYTQGQLADTNIPSKHKLATQLLEKLQVQPAQALETMLAEFPAQAETLAQAATPAAGAGSSGEGRSSFFGDLWHSITAKPIKQDTQRFALIQKWFGENPPSFEEAQACLQSLKDYLFLTEMTPAKAVAVPAKTPEKAVPALPMSPSPVLPPEPSAPPIPSSTVLPPEPSAPPAPPASPVPDEEVKHDEPHTDIQASLCETLTEELRQTQAERDALRAENERLVLELQRLQQQLQSQSTPVFNATTARAAVPASRGEDPLPVEP